MEKKFYVLIYLFLSLLSLCATCTSAAAALNSNVTADFSAAPASGTAPLKVTFTDISEVKSGSIQTWSWDFGDGNTSVDKKKTTHTHTYYNAGTYTVNLQVTTSDGSISTRPKDIVVTTPSAAPVAAFTASTTSGNAPLTVTFTDQSTGSPASWLWNFGDGTSSTFQNPAPHTYSTAGTYTVNLKVTNSDGASSSSSIKINVTSSNPTVVANFSSVSSGVSPLTVQFNDLSTGNPTTWSWNFGDGTSLAVQNPIHTYPAANTYTVILVAGNANSWNTVTKYITVGNGLQASFIASPSQGVAPLTVQFTDISTGNPISWFWDFGDGSSSTLQSPSHIYTQVGNFTVRLTASNNMGSNTSIPVSVNVSSANVPLPEFTSNVTFGSVPLTVQFSDLSTWTPTAWEWDFNSDGLVDSNLQNPVYQFVSPGSYNVTLRAGGLNGWSNITKINYITVGSDFQAGFTATPILGDAPLSVQFNDTSTGAPTSWFWDFGDGNNSTVQNPIHIYDQPGSYTVTLNASGLNGSRVLTMPNYITVTEAGESSSDGGGGGSSSTTSSGAGTLGSASPEPQSNIEVKLQEQRYISAGNHVIFEFAKNVTIINTVEFDAKKTLGKTTTTIEQLKGRSVLTPFDPVGKVYKYINIWVGNNGIAIPGNIENATVNFMLNKAEIQMNETELANTTGQSPVILQRYEHGEWTPLTTIKTGEDDQYVYFRAETPSFSSFAITSGEINQIKDVVPQQDYMSQNKSFNNATLLPKQPEKPAGFDWAKYSGVIRFFILFIVVLFIGLAIREKRYKD